MRERVAGWLDRTGALGAVMRLRSVAPLPTLSIVTYHHISEEERDYPFDPQTIDATPDQFTRHLELLSRYGTPIGIDELVRALDGGSLPRNPVMVTFDDGYRSCHDTALPILQRMGVPATFFVSTAFVNDRRLYWWERIALIIHRAKHHRTSIEYPKPLEIDRRDASLRQKLFVLVKTTEGLDIDRFLDELSAAFGVEWSREVEGQHADKLIMSWDHVRALANAGMDVESHGRLHRVLQTLDDAALESELTGSRKELEAQLGRPVRALAYPVGRRVAQIPRIREAIASAGYRVGMSNKTGVNRFASSLLRGFWPIDPFDIRRLATDRTYSDAMFLMQLAVPQLAYVDRD